MRIHKKPDFHHPHFDRTIGPENVEGCDFTFCEMDPIAKTNLSYSLFEADRMRIVSTSFRNSEELIQNWKGILVSIRIDLK